MNKKYLMMFTAAALVMSSFRFRQKKRKSFRLLTAPLIICVWIMMGKNAAKSQKNGRTAGR